MLTGKYTEAPRPTSSSTSLGGPPTDKRLNAVFTERVNDRALAIAREVVGVAREIGATPAQVALAWLRTRPGSVIPIMGARRLEQARDNFACLDVTLGREHVERLDEVSRIELGFPHEFIGAPVMQDRRSGGTYDLMVQHREP